MSFVVEDRRRWALPTLLRERAQELGDKTLVSCAVGDGRLTYGEADEQSDRLAAGLAELGIARGDRALVMMGNRIEFVLSWFALNKLGACHAPVNLDYRGDFLEHLANTAQAKVMIIEERFLETVVASQDNMPHLEHLIVVGDTTGRDTGRFTPRPFASAMLDAAPPAVDVLPSDVYAVMFTSGSTGRSKGALLPHAHGHLLNERNAELLGMDRDSVYSTELPLFHINAHMTVWGSMLHGAEARLEERFSASRWLERVRASGATHTSVLGVIVDFLLRQPVADDDADNPLRAAWMVPCLPDMADRFRDRYGLERIVTSYGTSETGMVSRRVVERGAEDVAMDVDATLHEIEVVGDDDEPLPVGEAGEIVVRPRLRWTTALGYFGMADNTIAAMRNLWFHTGDVGRFDEQGRLTFVDRVQDRLRRRGENVASGDVEYVIGQHEAIAEVAVVAVAADEEGGEDEIKACVVVAQGVDLDPAELWEYCDRRLPYFAVPRYLEVFTALPKTPTEKIIKGELRKQGAGLALHDRGIVARPARTSAGAAS